MPAGLSSSVPLGGLDRGYLASVLAAVLVGTGAWFRSAAASISGHIAVLGGHVRILEASSCTRVASLPVFLHVYLGMAVLIFIFLDASCVILMYYLVGFLPTNLGI